MSGDTENKLTVSVHERYIEDAKQGQRLAPHLVESRLRPSGLAKRELRRFWFKMGQFRHQIQKIGVCTFEMSGEILDSDNVAIEALI